LPARIRPDRKAGSGATDSAFSTIMKPLVPADA
jgi:hypothetical protein